MVYIQTDKKVYSHEAGRYVTTGRDLRKVQEQHGIINLLDKPDSIPSQIMRDRTMMRHINGGNERDPGLIRDVSDMTRERDRNRKEAWIEEKLARIERLKRGEEYVKD